MVNSVQVRDPSAEVPAEVSASADYRSTSDLSISH